MLFIKWTQEYNGAITAIATVLLCVVTAIYAFLTWFILDSNQKQFDVINRAVVTCLRPEGSRVNGGVIQLANIGNLSAKDIKLEWKIVKVKGGEVLVDGDTDSFKGGRLVPEQIERIPYRSKFEDSDDNIFLLVAWKYKGKGIPEYRVKSKSFYWNMKNPQLRYWANTNYIDYKEQLAVIDNIMKSELYKKLGVDGRLQKEESPQLKNYQKKISHKPKITHPIVMTFQARRDIRGEI